MAADGMLQPDRLGVALVALLDAVEMCAQKGSGATDAREVKEFAQSAQAFAQAFAVLDPGRLTGGDTPEGRRAAMPPQPTRDGDRDGRLGER